MRQGAGGTLGIPLEILCISSRSFLSIANTNLFCACAFTTVVVSCANAG